MVSQRSAITINLDYLRDNVTFLKKKNIKNICAVVKANAYGHGIDKILNTLVKEGITWFAVSSVDEGIEVRKLIGKKVHIIVFPDFYCSRWQQIYQYNLIPVIHSFKVLESFLLNSHKGQQFHLEFDTGMTRTGFRVEDCPQIVKKLKCHKINMTGVYTHLISSIYNKNKLTCLQVERFSEVVKCLRQEINSTLISHIENSSAILFPVNGVYEISRIGLSLYGIELIDKPETSKLRPILEWVSKPIQILTVLKGSSVSYEQTWKAKRDSKIAVIPVGYADGYPRALSNKGKVLFDGRLVPIIGNICMDFMMVDVTDCGLIEIDSEVILIGGRGDVKVKISDLAKWAGTIPYEIMCNIGQRTKFEYEGG
jgi:alanine racemase